MVTHRLAGFVEPEIIQIIQKEVEQDAGELQLADKISREYGVDIAVQRVHEGDLQQIYHRGYAAPFVFTEDLEGDTVQFVTEKSDVIFLVKTVIELPNDDKEDPANLPAQKSHQSLSEFYYNQPILPLTRLTAANHNKTTVPYLKESVVPAITVPPPRFC